MSTDDPEVKEVARIRDGAHPDNPIDKQGGDGDQCQLFGVTGEQHFARTFGLPLDKRALPAGDGCADFTILFEIAFGRRERIVTIDVKAAQSAIYLFIKEPDIARCADILVLCALDGPKPKKDEPPPTRTPRLIGWETKSMMQLMPVADFGYGRNFYRAAAELRPISQLANILATRKAPWVTK